MCTNVECLPKFHVSSRDQYDDIPDVVAVTMNYIVDDSHITDNKKKVEAWLSYVTQKAMHDFQVFFDFTLNISYTITYLKSQSDLKLKLKPYEVPFLQPEGAISALTDYFKDRSHSDIICLVTNEGLNDGSIVRNGYGYSGKETLCQDGLTILLAYVAGHEGYSSHMLLRLIMDSIGPGIGGHVFNLPFNDAEQKKVIDFLRTCKNKREDGASPSHPVEPLPPPKPPIAPSEPEQPAPPQGPPAPPPEEPEAPTPTPPRPQPPPEPAPPEEPPVTTTTTTEAPLPDYC
uniref:Putative p32 protein n=1 Tax=Ixodes ricinus TaxID=34613 RepID=A0A0K8RFS8_IXORI